MNSNTGIRSPPQQNVVNAVMGSLATEADDGEKETHVLVTGFGPFGENTTNPSYLIASSLPSTYKRHGIPTIHVHPHPSPIPVAYSQVRALIPNLLFENDTEILSPATETMHNGLGYLSVVPNTPKASPKYDIVLNIGMAPGRKFYTLETCAHRDGYNKPDIEGKTLQGDTYWKEEYNAPEELYSGFNTDDLWRRWKSSLMTEDVRPSNNAGHYLCDFTYYTCQLEYWRRDPNAMRPCMFLHVPGGWNEEDILKGREVALGLIVACVSSQVFGGVGRWGASGEKLIADDFGDEGLS